jgi:hypothetical protein
MTRITVMLVLLCRIAAADSNTFTLDGNAMIGIGPMVGGSLHYEHRFDDDAVTARAAVAVGFLILDDTAFRLGTVFIGYRHYWGRHLYGEAEVGVAAMRQGRHFDDEYDYDMHYGVRWQALPDSQMTLGAKLGPVDVGVYTSLPFVGLGVQLGFDFARW